MKVLIATDHAGYELKEKLVSRLLSDGYTVEDLGAHEYDEHDDYPLFIRPLAERVARENGATLGIVLGGSGQGEAIVANRVPGIRAAVFYMPTEGEGEGSYDIVRLAREHNNANVLSLGARFLTEDGAYKAVTTFLTTPFSNDERHVRRIRMIEGQ